MKILGREAGERRLWMEGTAAIMTGLVCGDPVWWNTRELRSGAGGEGGEGVMLGNCCITMNTAIIHESCVMSLEGSVQCSLLGDFSEPIVRVWGWRGGATGHSKVLSCYWSAGQGWSVTCGPWWSSVLCVTSRSSIGSIGQDICWWISPPAPPSPTTSC